MSLVRAGAVKNIRNAAERTHKRLFTPCEKFRKILKKYDIFFDRAILFAKIVGIDIHYQYCRMVLGFLNPGR